MQPQVIPVELRFRWVVLTLLIMVVGMSVIQFVMSSCPSWWDELLVCLKVKNPGQEEEDDLILMINRECQEDAIPDVYSQVAEEDLESSLKALGTRALGTRVLRGSRTTE